MGEKPKISIQQAIDEIEAFAEKQGYGVFESETTDNDARGDFHVIPCSRLGVAVSPHIASTTCICTPKCIKDEPVKIFVHKQIL